MKSLSMLLAALLLAVSPPVLHKIKASSVLITYSSNTPACNSHGLCFVQKAEYVCSGVIIKHVKDTIYRVATAGHCVNPTQDDDLPAEDFPILDSMKAQTLDGDTGRFIKASLGNDDDVEVVTFKFHHWHPVAEVNTERLPAHGDPLYVFGNPPSGYWVFQRASFVKNELADREAYCYLCGPGDSGGGVWTTKGTLEGILSTYSEIHHVWYIPMWLVYEDLRRYF